MAQLDPGLLLRHLRLVDDTPSAVGSQGAVLSLAIHALLTQYGFILVGPGRVPPPIKCPLTRKPLTLQPPSEWQAATPNEWNTEYALPGKAAVFRLTVALNAASGRVFVHASEDDNVNNIQILGLLIDVYLPGGPDALHKADATWETALCNAELLCGHMAQHIIIPLTRQARRGDPPLPSAGRERFNLAATAASILGKPEAIAGLLILTSGAVLATLWFVRRHHAYVRASAVTSRG